MGIIELFAWGEAKAPFFYGKIHVKKIKIAQG